MPVYNLPPQLRGTPEQNIKAINDFLVRLVQTLEQSERSAAELAATPKEKGADTGTAKLVEQNARNLRALITKTAGDLRSQIEDSSQEVHSYVDSQTQNLSVVYLAKSEFGTFRENIQTEIETTARDTVESYDYDAKIEAANSRLDGVDTYITNIQGEIRRGIITDPETGEEQMGIAISEKLSFTGNIHEENGLEYYELSPGQTLGLYTATGWQFWVNGSKRGWFDSEDGMLHVANIVIGDRQQMGADWLVTTTGGYGIRYIGG